MDTTGVSILTLASHRALSGSEATTKAGTSVHWFCHSRGFADSSPTRYRLSWLSMLDVISPGWFSGASQYLWVPCVARCRLLTGLEPVKCLALFTRSISESNGVTAKLSDNSEYRFAPADNRASALFRLQVLRVPKDLLTGQLCGLRFGAACHRFYARPLDYSPLYCMVKRPLPYPRVSHVSCRHKA